MELIRERIRGLKHSRLCLASVPILIFVFGAGLLSAVTSPHVRFPFGSNASSVWYAVTYEHGFVRRGLVGSLILVVPGDARAVTAWILATLGTAAAVLVLVAVAIRISSSLDFEGAGCLTGLLVLASPLYAISLMKDVGRLDGFVALFIGAAGLVASRDRSPRGLILIVTVALSVIATLIQEFAFLFFIPLIVVATLVTRGEVQSRLSVFVRSTLAVVPSAAVFFWSYFSSVSPTVVTTVAQRWNVPNQSIELPGSALWALSQDVLTGWRFTIMSGGIGISLLALGTVYFLTVLAIGLITKPQAIVFAWSIYLGSVALGLSLVGIDGRRWWALAFITWIAVVAAYLKTGDGKIGQPQAPLRPVETVVISTVLVVSIASVGMPLTHVEFLPWIFETATLNMR